MDVRVIVVGYVLANAVGEVTTIPARIDETVGREIVAAGWKVYRVIRR